MPSETWYSKGVAPKMTAEIRQHGCGGEEADWGIPWRTIVSAVNASASCHMGTVGQSLGDSCLALKVCLLTVVLQIFLTGMLLSSVVGG